jgi:lipoprotein-anchoring transpeptidase ErfK/SrfK
MADYYSLLLRAVSAPGAGDARWRHSVYERARQMLAADLRATRPPASLPEVAAEQAALEAAVERIEAEMSWTNRSPADADRADDADIADRYDGPAIGPDRPLIEPSSRLSRTSWMAFAVVAAIAAGGYIAWLKKAPSPAPAAAIKSQAARTLAPVRTVSAEKDGDLAPGIDGGSSEADLSYVYRRQPTFYRTPQPVGTIIIDKPQRFLYLIQPNNVALRYGIGVGRQCAGLAGLHHITSKAEWPQWQAPADALERKPAPTGPIAGGPGNPLGARLMTLDDGKSSIHGTNAPKTIGTSVTFGCIRLVNDDIVDLYNRVQLSTAVIAGD